MHLFGTVQFIPKFLVALIKRLFLIAEWRGKSTSLLGVKLASLLSIELSPHLFQLLRLNIDSLGLA